MTRNDEKYGRISPLGNITRRTSKSLQILELFSPSNFEGNFLYPRFMLHVENIDLHFPLNVAIFVKPFFT